jgi:DNA-3-methyladenine glycosylase II
VQRYGAPPLWSRLPGFATLIRIILEQQVSLSSARAAYNRLEDATEGITPTSFLRLNDEELKTIGFSRQKTRYGRLLARSILDGSVDLEVLEGYHDEEARSRLRAIKGIGRWSADIYLLMALRRPDVWPHNDLALIKAVTRIKELKSHPSGEEWDAIGEAWRPWRSVAARLAWFEYLGGKP